MDAESWWFCYRVVDDDGPKKWVAHHGGGPFESYSAATNAIMRIRPYRGDQYSDPILAKSGEDAARQANLRGFPPFLP